MKINDDCDHIKMYKKRHYYTLCHAVRIFHVKRLITKKTKQKKQKNNNCNKIFFFILK